VLEPLLLGAGFAVARLRGDPVLRALASKGFAQLRMGFSAVPRKRLGMGSSVGWKSSWKVSAPADVVVDRAGNSIRPSPRTSAGEKPVRPIAQTPGEPKVGQPKPKTSRPKIFDDARQARRRWPIHSARRAVMGSPRTARHAGSRLPNTVMATQSLAAARNVALVLGADGLCRWRKARSNVSR